MRIAILTNSFPPDGRGGAERTAYIQAIGLLEHGHDVRVWAPKQEGEGDESDQVSVTRFSSPFSRLSRMSSFGRLLFHLLLDHGSYPSLVRDIAEWKPDVLLSHNLTGCGFGTPLAISRRGIRWVHFLHDVQLTEPSGLIRTSEVSLPKAKTWRSFWSRFRRRTFGSPDVLVSPTQWLLDWHREYGFTGKAEKVLPNPIWLEPMDESRHLALPGSLLYVGRLSEDKGFDDFLSTIKILDKDLRLSGIVIVGDGPLADDAKLIKDERIECCGWRDPEEVRISIKNAVLLIAPSHVLENQQTILIEAMAEGTPVIATDVGGTKETLEGTGCPVLPISQNLSLFIASEVKKLLEDRDCWQSVSRAMRERAETRHDAEVHIRELEKVLGG